jgi:hypothetical protein
MFLGREKKQSNGRHGSDQVHPVCALNSVISSRIEASVQQRGLILIDEPHVGCTTRGNGALSPFYCCPAEMDDLT